MSNRWLLKKCTSLFFIVLLILPALNFLIPKQAEAADIDGLPQYLNSTYDQYISRVPDVGGKGNYTPSFRFILYSPEISPGIAQSSSVRVTRGGVSPYQTAPPRCGDFDLSKAFLSSDNADSGNSTTSGTVGINEATDCVDTSYGFRIEGLNRWAKSDRFSSPSYMGTVITLTLKSNPDGASTFADIEVIGGGDRLSYMGDQTSPPGTPSSANGVSMSLPQDSGNTITAPFAPPCNYSGGTQYVWWKDADSGEDTNGGHKVDVELQQKNSSGEWTRVKGKDGGTGGGHTSMDFTPVKGKKYRLVFNPVRARNPAPPPTWAANTIKAWVPFDSAASYVKCPPPAGDIGTCGATVHFSIPGSNGVRVRVYALNSDGSAPSSPVYSKVHKETTQVDLDKDVGLDKLNSNQGWWVLVKPADGDGNPTGPNDEDPSNGQRDWKSGPCFNVSCSVEIFGNIPGDGVSGRVMAGSSVTARMYLTNNGGNFVPASFGGSSQLGVNSDIGFAAINGLAPGQTDSEDLIFTAPGGIGSHSFNAYPDMHYKFGLAGGCPPTYHTFQQFDTTGNPTINLSTDSENPTQVTANATISRNGGQTNAPIVSANLRITRNGATVGTPTNQTGSPWQWAGNVTVPQSQLTAAGGVRNDLGWRVGDRICARLEYTFKDGWLGPGNVVVAGHGSGPLEDCDQVTNRPYVSVYGNDASAGGGGLGRACSTAQSNISAYSKQGGSGTQLAAYANGTIGDFKTAFLRGTVATPTLPAASASPFLPDGLKFASYGEVDCATDYYTVDQFTNGDARKATSTASTMGIGALANNGQTVVTPVGGKLNLTGGSFSRKHTIFVDGDVYITGGNISYSTSTWANIDAIPYFNLVVKGNIYIDPAVTQLDGRYVAQPRDDGSRGEIYTCAPGGNSPGEIGSDLWNNCRTRLTVNGQFVAKTVRFLRSLSTLSDGTYKERQDTSKAAEMFNFSPEMYLARPAVRPTATSTSGEYEYITTLPPIL